MDTKTHEEINEGFLNSTLYVFSMAKISFSSIVQPRVVASHVVMK